MKFPLLISLLFIPFLAIAQMNNDAPWLQNENDNTKASELSLQEISNRANAYFSQIDITKKGSGYKPFKRSEYHWSYYKEEDGTIASAEKLWQAWEKKKILEQQSNMNRGIQVVSDWYSVGPSSFIDSGSWSAGQGRVNVVVVDPNDASTYYIGAPAGGIWKSKDAGQTWSPLSDSLPQIGVSGIAIDPNDSDIIYITTGDDDAGDSYFVGVKKSTDGGQTWNDTGALSGDSANEIYVDPTNSNIVWAATNTGLFKSIDAAASWNNMRTGNIKDFKLKPGSPNTIYAVTLSQFYKSTNGGTSFAQILFGLPDSSSRLTLDVTPANPSIVYVLSAISNNFQGVYKSVNSGGSFSKTNQNSDIFNGSTQAWFDLALGVSDTDENTLFVGVLNVWKSINGGDNFSQLNSWNNDTAASYTHADIHFLRYYNGQLFAGTDGGVYHSSNDGANFTSLTSGLAISQFYKISVSEQSSNNMVGGLQDNGGFAASANQWYNYYGADGMDAAVDPTDQNTYYGFVQSGGTLYRTTDGGASAATVTGKPSGETGNWVTPLVANSNGVIYAGYNKLYKLVNDSWSQVSNQSFGGRLNNIEIDPNNDNLIYISRGLNLFKSTGGGGFFTQINFTFSGSSISAIEIHNSDSDTVWVTTSGSGGKVYQSTDAGVQWTDITSNLPSESKNAIRHQDYHSDNPLYVATALGVYYTDDTTSDWAVFSTNLPNVFISDIEINRNDGIITASTYGRGVWQSEMPVILSDNDVRLVSIKNPDSGVQCGAVTPSIEVKNNGLNSISAIDISYAIDGTNYNETWNGNLASEEIVIIELQERTLDKGTHELEVTTTIVNDTYEDNNTATTSFLTNDLDDDPTQVNTFEEASDTWLVDTSGAAGDLWQMAAPGTTQLNTVASGSKAYITNPTGNYPDMTSSNLISPCYDLSTLADPVLNFKMAFDIEVDWDVLYMQYSTDNGATWAVLGTANDPNWYNNSSSTNALTIGGQWSGVVTTLTEYSYDLTALTNESSIIFRFHFASDQSVNGEGALIDDFVISGQSIGIDDFIVHNVKLYPNPASEQFTIDWPNDEVVAIALYDVTGKQLLNRQLSANSQTTIQLPNFTKGIYFVRFKTANKNFTKKLIID